MKNGRMLAILGVVALVLAGCAPAATPTSLPTRAPVATLAPTKEATTPTPSTSTAAPTPQPTLTPTRPAESGPKYGGVLKAVLTQDVETWELWRQAGAEALDIEGQWHEQLIDYYDGPPGCQLTPRQPSLATSWKWLDDVTVQFKLRQGVRFPNIAPMNGREFTAADVVYTVQKGWPNAGIISAPVKDQLKSVEAVDKYTVNLVLLRPYSPFVDRVPGEKRAFIIGPEMYGTRDVISRPEDHVGLGPFIFSEYRPGVRVSMRKNKDYFIEGRPYLDGISFSIIPDLATIVAALKAGRVDVFWFRGGMPVVDELRRSKGLENQICSHIAGQVVYMRNDQPPFNDVRVRRALSMAIDRDAMLKTVFLGLGVWQYSSVSPHFADFLLKLEDYPPQVQGFLKYDPEGARRLLSEAGYPKGFEVIINAPPSSYSALLLSIGEFLTNSFAQIGLNSSLRIADRGRYLSAMMTDRNYKDILLGYGPAADTVDTEIYDPFHSKSQVRNRAYINDPVIDELIEKSWATTDPSRYKDIARQHQIRAADQMYMVYLPHGPISAFWQPNVRNLYYGGVSRDNTFLRQVWLQ